MDELGFRYVRFHAIFHEVLGTVRIEAGKTVYNWSKIDQHYDDLLARHIKPFVEPGFPDKWRSARLLTSGQCTHRVWISPHKRADGQGTY